MKIDHDEVARKFILENEDQEGLTKTFINKCIGMYIASSAMSVKLIVNY